ncbi:major facilitator superfamily protein, putative [Ichthyophthirius multifiliis]|uniref:Major facilitator superfamily protein, putative n=1 Tax=Ichthyophthirius multifiliis TaxID=5932 RepID=G0QK79_ICHMU|nr:major facilitator superfamily protein, putative [Ichthyophthirius multifiliis]EGR34377.1 major facilitator superfamily protein, putative [Ichthyophthirius multifiliis]|eukprot:XP_004039681.1 major facilitator superfamily protein, putative [Ichthyophthirius multifiliis]
MNILLQKLNILTNSNQAKSTLSGAFLFNLGSGGILAWSSINVYFYSYFFHYDKNFTVQFAQMAFGMAFLLIGLVALFAVNIAQKVGFERLIRTCAILYILCVLASAICQKYIYFFIFYNVFASVSYCMTAIPILNCAWSQFDKKDSGKITGMCLFCLSISALFSIFLFTYLINSQNGLAEIIKKEGENEVRFFSQEISKKVPLALIQMGIFYSFLIIPGSLKIHKRIQMQQYEQFDREEQNNMQESGQTKSQIITDCLFSTPFLVFYTFNFLDAMYIGYLQLNFKIYGQNKIKDDQFLTFILLFNQIIGGLANLIFGYLIDKFHFKYCFILIQTCIGLLTFTMPFISTFKFLLFFWYITIGFVLNGLQTISGPVLMGIFGVDIGSKLLSVKSTAFFGGVIFVQVLAFFLNKFFTFDEVLHILGIVILFSNVLIKKIGGIQIYR